MTDVFNQKILDFLSDVEEESFYKYTDNPCDETKATHEKAKKKLLEYASKFGIA